MNTQTGFTLVEVMIATLITAILATMGITLLTSSLQTQKSLETATRSVQDLELARATIRRDLSQIAPRRWRDDFDQLSVGVFEGGFDLEDDVLMRFIRNGRITVGRLPSQSSLEYVEYRIENGVLSRHTYTHTDSIQYADPNKRALLGELENVRIRFRNGAQWIDTWTAPAGLPGSIAAPEAVSLSFVHPRYGEIESIFLTGALQ